MARNPQGYAGDPGAKQAGAQVVRTCTLPNGIVRGIVRGILLGTDLMIDPRQYYLKGWTTHRWKASKCTDCRVVRVAVEERPSDMECFEVCRRVVAKSH